MLYQLLTQIHQTPRIGYVLCYHIRSFWIIYIQNDEPFRFQEADFILVQLTAMHLSQETKVPRPHLAQEGHGIGIAGLSSLHEVIESTLVVLLHTTASLIVKLAQSNLKHYK